MASIVLKDASVVINSVDLSAWCLSAEISYDADQVEDTNMGDNTHIYLAGTLLNWTMTFEFTQDFAASAVHATLFSLVNTATTIVVKPTSGAVSATNPSWTGSGIIQSYPFLSGSVGDKATVTVGIVPAGDLAQAVS